MASTLTKAEDQVIMKAWQDLLEQPAFLRTLVNPINPALLPPAQIAFLQLKNACDDSMVMSHIYIWTFEQIHKGGPVADEFNKGANLSLLPMMRNMPRLRSGFNIAKATALVTTPNLEHFISSVAHKISVTTARSLQSKYKLKGNSDAELLVDLKQRLKPSAKRNDKWVELCGEAFNIVVEPEIAKAVSTMIELRNIAGHEPANLKKLGFVPSGEDVFGWLCATEVVAKRIYLSVPAP